MAPNDAPYSGAEKLVFGIDLGTTMSAVSICHMLPGTVPKAKLVTRWPGQEDAVGDCKLPSAVRYDSNGQAVAYGMDAYENPEALEGTTLAHWFKLRLHPQAMRANNRLAEIPPLPPGVPLETVYADLLHFVFEHAVEFFCDSAHDGATLWDRLRTTFELVLAIPNGWDAIQQGFLRRAAVRANVLPENHDANRLVFVSEAEASVHFALDHSDVARWLRVGTVFAVLDAGGSTVDTTLYRCTALQPQLALEEVTSSECVQAGSVFVDRSAQSMLQMKLTGSRFGNAENISEIMKIFEKKTKRRFDGGTDPSVIHFGRNSDNDPQRNISRGRLTLTSDEVALSFQSPFFDIIASLERILARADRVCEALLMVGGFAESPYLRKTLRDKFSTRGMQIISIDDGTRKAAAEGSSLWYIRQAVIARCTRSHFGTDLNVLYNPTKHPFHSERADRTFKQADGRMEVGPVFDVWCAKNSVVRWEDAQTFTYFRTYSRPPNAAMLGKFDLAVYACDGDVAPRWLYDNSGQKSRSHLSSGIRFVCNVSGDLSGLHTQMRQRSNPDGSTYWRVDFSVELFFGQTALCAQLVWTENGTKKKGPLRLVPNSVV